MHSTTPILDLICLLVAVGAGSILLIAGFFDGKE